MSTLLLRLDSARTLADESYLRPIDRAGLPPRHGPLHGLSLYRERGCRALRYCADAYGFSVPLPGTAGPCQGLAFSPLPRPAGLDVPLRLAPRRHLPLS